MWIFFPANKTRQTLLLVLYIVCSCYLFKACGIGGSFMTKIVMFRNDEGLTDTGHRCSPPPRTGTDLVSPAAAAAAAAPSATSSASSSSSSSSANCRTYFRICLSHYQAKINFSNCTFGSAYTGVHRVNSILFSTSDSPNVTSIDFNFAWPKDFTLTIEAWNDMSPEQAEHPNPNPGDELIYRHSQSYLNLNPSQQWLTNGSSARSMTLTFVVKVKCDETHYGSTCSTFCNARNDSYGHYFCDASDGAKICLDGWKNPDGYCMDAICTRCVNGDCRSPGNCSCRDGWTGLSCDTCIPSESCDRDHGYCKEPGTCICRDGWGGRDCKGDLQYCLHHVNTCENGGTCLNSNPGNFTCACARGYTGRTCSERVISSPCEPTDDCLCNLDGDCRCPAACSNPKSTSTTSRTPTATKATKDIPGPSSTDDSERTTRVVAYQSSTSGRDGFPLSDGQKLTLIVILGLVLPVLILLVVVAVYVVCRRRRKESQSRAENNNQQNNNNNVQNSRIYNKTKNCEVVIRNDCSKHNKNLNLLTSSPAKEKTLSKLAPPATKPFPAQTSSSNASQPGFDKFNKNLNRQNHTFSFENCQPSKDQTTNLVPLRPILPRLSDCGTYQHRPIYKSVVVSLEPGSPTKSPKRQHDSTIPRHDCFSPGKSDFCYVSSLSSDDSSIFSVHSSEEKMEATVV